MSPDTRLVETLQQLFQCQPELIRELKAVENAEDAVERIAVAAQRTGIVLDAGQRAALDAEIARKSRLMTLLGELIRDDAALAETLRTAGDSDQAVEAVMAAAAGRGLSPDTDELRACLQQILRMQSPGELSDEELSEVSGGLLGAILTGAGILGALGVLTAGSVALVGVGIANMPAGRQG